MSIKVLEKMPENMKPQSARSLVRKDIEDAIKEGITLFEFAGDYNYKTLGATASEVAHEFIDKRVREIQEKFKEENMTDDEKNYRGFYVHYKPYWNYKKYWINVFTRSGEEHRRVFCRIDDVSILDKAVVEHCNYALEKARREQVLVDGKWVTKKYGNKGE